MTPALQPAGSGLVSLAACAADVAARKLTTQKNAGNIATAAAICNAASKG